MAEHWKTGRTYSYGIFDPSEAILLGSAGIYNRTGRSAGDIAYWVRVGRTGRGIAFSAAAVLTGVALRQPEADRVEIHCDQANTASVGVARKLGYRLARVQDAARDAPPSLAGR